jgi:D-alanyl-D-alanine carboxypeptidase (penicillin-binding protein 5/6)
MIELEKKFMSYKHYKHSKLLVIALVIVLAMGIFQYLRPLSLIPPVVQLSAVTKDPAVILPWPSYGQSAFGAVGYGVLAENGSKNAVPLASITKIVTALAVLRQKPLAVNQQGPTIALNDADVAIFNGYYSENGSVVKVIAGEQISEYQALQAMLLPSANNMADSLARWAFGSQENYMAYANSMLSQLGLKQTHVADASGFSAQSVSSAHDLVLLGEMALSNPVLTQIVSQNTASVPVAGVITSTNSLLGKNGIVGVKTGFTDEAGGCYLVASSQTVEGQKMFLVGAILGAPDLKSAMNSLVTILDASRGGFQKITAVHIGQEVGYYKTPWGTTSAIAASQDLSLLTWKGEDVKLTPSLQSIKLSSEKGQNIGTISATAGENSQKVSAVLKQPLAGPSWHWRLFRK